MHCTAYSTNYENLNYKVTSIQRYEQQKSRKKTFHLQNLWTGDGLQPSLFGQFVSFDIVNLAVVRHTITHAKAHP